MTRRGVQRLLALVLALAVVSVAPTVAANVAGGRAHAPAGWAVPVLAGYAAVLVVLLLQALRPAGPAARAGGVTGPVWALVVLGDLALATFPLVSRGPEDDVPWVLSLSPVTVGAGAVAVSSLWGALVLTGVHLLLRLALQTSGVWTVPTDVAALEAIGLVVIAIAASVAVLAVRGSALQLETARSAAERAAAEAAAAEAVERENSRWDGIVHDDVLASLSLTAHARDEGDRARARLAAGRALTSVAREADGEAGATGPVLVADAVRRLGDAVLTQHPAADLQLAPGRTEALLSAEVLEALQAATVEACRNALRHGARQGVPPALRVRVRTSPEPGPLGPTDAGRLPGRLSVEVRDDGVGFDTRRSSPRLGLAVSVRRRAAVVGGRALVRSAPGVGTVVLLSVPLTAAGVRA
ncbi:ATP-binding protein [Kineococcus endophyticus]|uniref:ATP-binding protein n=1 Tax=Kineococcus endophyticus TaxID=1181883 RepID=A0ABV3PB28_9ACTN